MYFRHTAARLRFAIVFAAAILLTDTQPAFAHPNPVNERAALVQLNRLDLALASTVNRIARANAPLCDELMPQTGLILHSVGQYAPGVRNTARAVFGFETPLAVAAVLPDSPAVRAGVRGGDGIISVEGKPFNREAASSAASSALRDSAEAVLTGAPSNRPIRLRLKRNGEALDVTLTPVPACRTRFEVSTEISTPAQSDGRIIQVSADYIAKFDADALAVTVAHELAHGILRHRARLEAAGVSKGLLAEFGRNGRLNRQAEDEADRLSVSLLRNAGYDPAIAPRFWEARGRVLSGLFRSRTHAAPRARAAAMREEIARMATEPASKRPPLLDTRLTPLQ